MRTARKGFTLVEVIAALSLLAFSFLLGLSVLSQTGFLARETSTTQERSAVLSYVAALLQKGDPALAPNEGQTILWDYGDPRLSAYLPQAGAISVRVTNRGQTPEGTFRYEVNVCTRRGEEVCWTREVLGNPPQVANSLLTLEGTIKVTINCPEAGVTPVVRIQSAGGSGYTLTMCGVNTVNVPQGQYQITIDDILSDGTGIRYRGSLAQVGADQLEVSYAPVSGAIRLTIIYPPNLPREEQKGNVRVGSRSYSQSTLIRDVVPGNYNLTAASFSGTVDQYTFTFVPTPASATVQVNLGETAEQVVSYEATEGVVRFIPVGSGAGNPTLTKSVGTQQSTFTLRGNGRTEDRIGMGGATYELKDELYDHPYWVNGYPHRIVFGVKRQAGAPDPTCNDLIRLAYEEDPQGNYAVDVNRLVARPPQGGVLEVYWCPLPSYAKVVVSGPGSDQAMVSGLSWSKPPYLKRTGSTHYVPAYPGFLGKTSPYLVYPPQGKTVGSGGPSLQVQANAAYTVGLRGLNSGEYEVRPIEQATVCTREWEDPDGVPQRTTYKLYPPLPTDLLEFYKDRGGNLYHAPTAIGSSLARNVPTYYNPTTQAASGIRYTSVITPYRGVFTSCNPPPPYGVSQILYVGTVEVGKVSFDMRGTAPRDSETPLKNTKLRIGGLDIPFGQNTQFTTSRREEYAQNGRTYVKYTVTGSMQTASAVAQFIDGGLPANCSVTGYVEGLSHEGWHKFDMDLSTTPPQIRWSKEGPRLITYVLEVSCP